MSRYIVTDLTRFSTPEKVCTAVIDLASGQCFRPMPYLLTSRVQKLNIHPGAILDGEITLMVDAQNPHIEDASYEHLKYMGPASKDDFRAVLDRSLSQSVSSGFGINFAPDQKHIPVGQKAKCSIITVKISPSEFVINEDKYNPGRIKSSFTDGSGRSFRYLSITDKGFFDFARNHQKDGKLNELQRFLKTQEDIYLRVGVGRQYKSGDRDGYWLQVNGIYTFPEYLEEIRS